MTPEAKQKLLEGANYISEHSLNAASARSIFSIMELGYETAKAEDAELIKALREALEFYADKNNWLRDENGWRHDMIDKDLDDETLTDWEGRFSGRRARTTLAKMDGEK